MDFLIPKNVITKNTYVYYNLFSNIYIKGNPIDTPVTKKH